MVWHFALLQQMDKILYCRQFAIPTLSHYKVNLSRKSTFSTTRLRRRPEAKICVVSELGSENRDRCSVLMLWLVQLCFVLNHECVVIQGCFYRTCSEVKGPEFIKNFQRSWIWPMFFLTFTSDLSTEWLTNWLCMRRGACFFSVLSLAPSRT